MQIVVKHRGSTGDCQAAGTHSAYRFGVHFHANRSAGHKLQQSHQSIQAYQEGTREYRFAEKDGSHESEFD
jgi:hypothetical protein